jgi:iron complex outermembrane receptor protein
MTVDLEARRERYVPWRRYPRLQAGPDQERDQVEAGIEDRIRIGERLALHAGLRFAHRNDRFSGDLRTPYSQRPAHASTDDDLLPRCGARLRVGAGFLLRANYGEYVRPPGFQELFGDGGSLAGSSDLVPEEGIDRDVGLEWRGTARGVDLGAGVTHFHNHAEHLIMLLPQSQRTFVARNIGAAQSTGEEWYWRAAGGGRMHWSLSGGLTRLDARDQGTDIRWYTGKALPGRPARQLDQRVELGFGILSLGYDYEHLGQNYLDRWNREVVAQRDLHGLDVNATWHGASVSVGLQNLTDERAADVGGFPLPGRTFFASTSFKL